MMLLVFHRLTSMFTIINGSFKPKSYKLVNSQLQIYFWDKRKSRTICAVKHASICYLAGRIFTFDIDLILKD